jgi:hypothetical protein
VESLNLKPKAPSRYAQEGTDAHKLAELLLSHRDPNFLEAVQFYVNYVTTLKDQLPNSHLRIEAELDLSKYVPESFGTSDAIIFNDDELHVIDLKFGKGVKVFTKYNFQLRLYALGALAKYKIKPKTTTLHIVQPRLNHISTISYSTRQLKNWGIMIKPLAQQAYSGEDSHFAASDDACRWCGGFNRCPATKLEWPEDM